MKDLLYWLDKTNSIMNRIVNFAVPISDECPEEFWDDLYTCLEFARQEIKSSINAESKGVDKPF